MIFTPKMLELLAQASVMAEGPSQAWDAPTSHGKADGGEPRSEGRSLHDRMVDRFRACNTVRDQQRAEAWAAHELTRFRRRPIREPSSTEREFWAVEQVRGTRGMDYKRVAEQTGLSQKVVWKVRRDRGLDPRTGHEKAA